MSNDSASTPGNSARCNASGSGAMAGDETSNAGDGGTSDDDNGRNNSGSSKRD